MTAYPSSYTDRTTRFLAPCAARRAGLGVHLGRPGRLLGAGPGPYLGPAVLAIVAPGQRAPEPSRRTRCATPGCVTDHRPRACRPLRPARAPPLEEPRARPAR